MIAAERNRQTDVEGWSSHHDDQHDDGEMLNAAISYAKVTDSIEHGAVFECASWNGKFLWPWSDAWWKPSEDPIRNLVKAGALIAAEIDRLKRLKDKSNE